MLLYQLETQFCSFIRYRPWYFQLTTFCAITQKFLETWSVRAKFLKMFYYWLQPNWVCLWLLLHSYTDWKIRNRGEKKQRECMCGLEVGSVHSSNLVLFGSVIDYMSHLRLCVEINVSLCQISRGFFSCFANTSLSLHTVQLPPLELCKLCFSVRRFFSLYCAIFLVSRMV